VAFAGARSLAKSRPVAVAGLVWVRRATGALELQGARQREGEDADEAPPLSQSFAEDLSRLGHSDHLWD
jgi:hypothetical protein